MEPWKHPRTYLPDGGKLLDEIGHRCSFFSSYTSPSSSRMRIFLPVYSLIQPLSSHVIAPAAGITCYSDDGCLWTGLPVLSQQCRPSFYRPKTRARAPGQKRSLAQSETVPMARTETLMPTGLPRTAPTVPQMERLIMAKLPPAQSLNPLLSSACPAGSPVASQIQKNFILCVLVRATAGPRYQRKDLARRVTITLTRTSWAASIR